MRRFYFDSFYYNTLVAPCLSSLIAEESHLNIEVGIAWVLDERRQSFTGKVIVKRVVVLRLGCCHYGQYRWHRFWIGFWIEKLKSTMASRNFREGGLCFKGGRSATVPYRVPSRDCSLRARLAVERPSSDDFIANLRLVLLILLAPFQRTTCQDWVRKPRGIEEREHDLW